MGDFAPGVDGTGIAPPTGGSGICGWLSGAYATLQSLLSSIASQAIATSTATNPTAQMLTIQEGNDRLLLGLFNTTTPATLFTYDLHSSGTPFSTISLNVISAPSGASIILQGCNEPSTSSQDWQTIQVQQGINSNTSSNLNSVGIYYANVPYAYIRVVVSGNFTGTCSLSAFLTKQPLPHRQVAVVGSLQTGLSFSQYGLIETCLLATTSNSPVATGQAAPTISTLEGAQITRPYSIPQAEWSYAAASGGIVNSVTPVTLVAATSGKRNYLTNLSIDHDVIGTASEITILDGVTVIWRGRLGSTAQTGIQYTFPNPLRSSAGASLNVAMVSAVTGAVYVNAQGYVAA